VDDNTLAAAAATLATAFTSTYQDKKGTNYSSTNYRLHELMLQLIALNNSIPPAFKWIVFNEKTRQPVKPGKRQH